MPDRIYVTYTPTNFPGAFHTAIHYQRRDSNGKLISHSVIEVQPEAKGMSDKAIGVMEEATRSHRGLTRLGRMDAQVTDVMADKPKKEFDPNSPYEDIAEGDDLSSHFARMQLYAHGVNRVGIAYRGSHQNSNSFASGALKAGGLRGATGVGRDPLGPAGELLEFFAPGLNDPLKSPVGGGAGSVTSREFGETAGPADNRGYQSSRAPIGASAFRPFGIGGQFVPGSVSSSRPLYEARSFVAPLEKLASADTGKEVRRLVRLPIR